MRTPAFPSHREAFTTLALLVTLLAPATLVAAPPASASPAVAPSPQVLPAPVTDIPGVEKRIYRDGRVYIGGQPSAESLAALAKDGVTAIVNLRTPTEMANREAIPYDEAAAAAKLGLDYVEVPIGGDDHPYRPEALDRLQSVLDSHPGGVYLHCHTGTRASYVWAGYLVRDLHFSIDDALAHGRAIGVPPDPLAQLLDRPLRVEVAAPTANDH